MIVKFFNRGGKSDNKISTGGESVKNYLLGKDNDRENASLLRGDPNETTEIINGLGFSQIYTAGCLSFDGEETQRVDDQLKQKLMNDFERSLFGDFDKSRISGYWVEHKDKKDPRNGLERLELNFVFANVDLMTGKNLTVYLHKTDQGMMNDFRDLAVLQYDLNDPNAPDRKQTSVINSNQSQNQKDLKQAIDNHLITLASQKKLPDHQAVKQALTDLGLEITAVKNSSISIKNPDPTKTRPIRLTGAFYGKQYSALNHINRAENSPSAADRQQRIDELSARLESRIAKRTTSLFDKMRPRKGAGTEPARAKFDRVSDSRKQDTPTDPSDYQPTNDSDLYSGLVSFEHNSFNSDPSLVHAKAADNSFGYGSYSRFIDRILSSTQSPATNQNGVNNNEQRDNDSHSANLRSNGKQAKPSLSGFRKSISGYVTEFAIRTKRSIELLDEAIASERSSTRQLRNGIDRLEKEIRANTRIKADPAPEPAPSPTQPFTPPAKAGSEKDNRGEFSEFEYRYGLIPPSHSDPAPTPAKLQEYGLTPPPNADEYIIEYGAINKNDNERSSRHQPLRLNR